MKLQEIKFKIYDLTCTNNTKDLKKQRKDLTKNRDLRYKSAWIEMLAKVEDMRANGQEFSIKDLDKAEQMLKESLLTVGKLSGMSKQNIELDWKRIQLDTQYQTQFNNLDIHIEDL